MRTTESRRPLRLPAFRWYFAGTAVSLLGNAMAPVALAFSVLSLSGSTADLSLVLVAHSVPLVVFVVVGGAVADRFSRSALLTLSNLGAAITQGVVAVLLLTGRYELGVVMALAALSGTFSAFTTPAMRGIVAQLVDPPLRQRTNSLLALARSIAQILGPVLSGVIVAGIGGGWAVAADAATFLFAAFCMTRLTLPQGKPSSRNLLADIREGWTTFRSITWLWTVVASMCVANLVMAGMWGVLGPTIAVHTLGATAWGVVLSARAVGVLIASALMYRAAVTRLLLVGQLSFALAALPMLALGLWPALPVLVVASLLGGFGAGILSPAWHTVLQDRIPQHLLSRVTSFDDLAAYVAVPIGQIATGPVAWVLGESTTAIGGGLLFLTAVLAPLSSRSVRRLC